MATPLDKTPDWVKDAVFWHIFTGWRLQPFLRGGRGGLRRLIWPGWRGEGRVGRMGREKYVMRIVLSTVPAQYVSLCTG